MKQRELIDYCNRHTQGGGGCPCEFDYECSRFEYDHGVCPYLEDKYHDGEYYTDEEVDE